VTDNQSTGSQCDDDALRQRHDDAEEQDERDASHDEPDGFLPQGSIGLRR